MVIKGHPFSVQNRSPLPCQIAAQALQRLFGLLVCSDCEQFLADSWRSGAAVSCAV